jgi:hypothetical protein
VRDTWLVREDARIEILTLAQAAEIYGVVLDPTSREVDEQATERIRRRAGDGAP